MKEIIKLIARYIALFVLALVIFAVLPIPMHEIPRGIFGTILFIACIYISFIPHTAIHELGHFVAGKMSGYNLVWIGAYNTIFIKKNGKWLRKKFHQKGAEGHCLMSPPEMINGKYPFVFPILAGSLMNFLASAISLTIFFIFFPQSWILVIFAGAGILMGIYNIIPIGLNDGHSILVLSKSEVMRRASWFTQKYLEEIIIKDMRPRDICEEQFGYLYSANPLNKDSQDEVLDTTPYRFNRLMDKHEFEEAKVLAEESLAATEGFSSYPHKNELLSELLFIELIGECRKEEVERLYTKELKQYIKTASSYDVSIQRLLYAYAKLFLQDDAEAAKALEKFNKVALYYPALGEIECNREMIEIVDRLAEERKGL